MPEIISLRTLLPVLAQTELGSEILMVDPLNKKVFKSDGEEVEESYAAAVVDVIFKRRQTLLGAQLAPLPHLSEEIIKIANATLAQQDRIKQQSNKVTSKTTTEVDNGRNQSV